MSTPDTTEHSATAAGLSAADAAARLRRDGPNLLPQPDRRRWPAMLRDVLREPMLLLLLLASGLYLLLGDARDAAVLGASVLLVVALTLYQELRSERALQALRDLSSPRARVVRDGVARIVATRELVVGDRIELGEGERVPADAAILGDDGVEVDESLLTGESLPVPRSASAGVDGRASARADASGGDARSILRAGTLIVRGHAAAVVVATGAKTEMGRIGLSLRATHGERTPLQREMRRVVAWFAAIGIASCALMFALYGLLRGDWLQAFLAGVTLAMSNIPEEFPVVLTVFLALGGWRMARDRVLVRRPPAIEALGSVTVLCTDKTGTLTENRMALVDIAIGSRPAQSLARTTAAALADPERVALLRCARLASAAQTHDPMDRAILDSPEVDAVAQHLRHARCLRRYPLTPALPAYTTVWRDAGDREAFDPPAPIDTADDDGVGRLRVACKGAPETVAALCALDPAGRARVLAQAAAMAARGLRVIAIAEARWPERDAGALPDDIRSVKFRWRGLLGFADPLRAGVAAAVAEARAAGVRVVMLTGDHPETARAIAAQAGLAVDGGVALGDAIDALDDRGFADAAQRGDVFARVKPAHKLRLVDALKRRGEVVAMTGDGVNDAPALTAAHVGVAMGARGTDVAREAAAIVLLDDDFASIVRAIRMGRAIYDNIRRAARYIIAVHVPITGLALLPLLLDAPLILLPLHVVFLELIVDPACSFVFEREPPAEDAMRRPPRAANARLIDAGVLFGSLARGLIAFAAVLLVYLLAGRAGLPHPQQAALAFAALVVANLGLIVAHRGDGSLWHALRRPNPAFRIVALATLSVLAAIVLLPGASGWFGFAPPPLPALALAVAAPTFALIAIEALWRRPGDGGDRARHRSCG